MNTILRSINPADADECGRIVFEAFRSIADKHNFRWDFPSAEMGVQFAQALIANPSIYGVVAEVEGKIVGSNFLWEYDSIRAVGPITIDPALQAKGVGRKLMQNVIERGKDAVGIRLVQDAFNAASMSLYTSLGFDIREPLVEVEGVVTGSLPDGYEVRRLLPADHAQCERLSRQILGVERINELKNTPPFLTSYVALRDGLITAYASAPNMWVLNHAVAETDADLQALLIGAGMQSGQALSFLLPTRQSEMFRWCLASGLRVVKPLSLMSMGQYEEPKGAYLPSVGY